MSRSGSIDALLEEQRIHLKYLKTCYQQICQTISEIHEKLPRNDSAVPAFVVDADLLKLSEYEADRNQIADQINDCQQFLRELNSRKENGEEYYEENDGCWGDSSDDDGQTSINLEGEGDNQTPGIHNEEFIVLDNPSSQFEMYERLIDSGFSKRLKKSIAELRDLSLSVSGEANHLSSTILTHLEHNVHVVTYDDERTQIINFILEQISFYSNVQYLFSSSFPHICDVRDKLIRVLARHSDDATGVIILQAIIRILFKDSNLDKITDSLALNRANLILFSEIQRYLTALSNPVDYTQLTYLGRVDRLTTERMIRYYDNDCDEDSSLYIDSLSSPVQTRYQTYRTWFINRSYAPYQPLKAADFQDFLEFSENFLSRYGKDLTRALHLERGEYFSYIQSDQIILVKKGTKFSVRYRKHDKKLTFGYLQTHAFNADGKPLATPSGQYIICQPINEIMKYAGFRFGRGSKHKPLGYLSPANGYHEGGYANLDSSTRDQSISIIMGDAHF